MRESSARVQKIPLALEFSLQVIWVSLIWFFLFMSVFSALTWQTFNWMSTICLLLMFGLLFLKKHTYLVVEQEGIRFLYFMGVQKKYVAATQINEILVDEGSRHIQLVSGEGQLLHSFYLSNKNKRRFHHSVKHLYRKQYN